MRKISCFSLLLAMWTAVLCWTPADATTLRGPTDAVTGINGLTANGVTYDVTFIYDTYNNIFSLSPPTFLGDGGGAVEWVHAIVDFLNDKGATGIASDDPSSPSVYFLIPYNLTTTENNVQGQYYYYYPIPAWDHCCTLSGNTDILSLKPLSYATFSFSTVPLPPSSLFFVSGLGALGLLGWLGKRKKAPDMAAA